MGNSRKITVVQDDGIDTDIVGLVAKWLSEKFGEDKVIVVDYRDSSVPEASLVTIITDNHHRVHQIITCGRLWDITNGFDIYWNAIILSEIPDCNVSDGKYSLPRHKLFFGTDTIKDEYLFDVEKNAKWNK